MGNTEPKWKTGITYVDTDTGETLEYTELNKLIKEDDSSYWEQNGYTKLNTNKHYGEKTDCNGQRWNIKYIRYDLRKTTN